MANSDKFGKLIVLEGIDGCGKSTHAKMLSKKLKEKGIDVIHTEEPSKGKIGMILREYLKKEAPPIVDALLFTADRAEHVQNVIEPALEEKKVVLCERYFYSTIAYQKAQGLDSEWIEELNSFAPIPDLTILLDIPANIAVNRTSSQEKFENREFLEKVRENYLELAKRFNFKIVDVATKKGEVQEEIFNIISRELKI